MRQTFSKLDFWDRRKEEEVKKMFRNPETFEWEYEDD